MAFSLKCKNAPSRGLIALIFGIFLLFLYLYNLRVCALSEFILWISLIVISGGMIYLWYTEHRILFLVSLYFLSLFLASWFYIRFHGQIFGADIQVEFSIAEDLSKTHKWTVELATPSIAKIRYVSALSVTILPVIIADISGLSILRTFQFVFPFIFSLTPVLLFLIFEKVFRPEVAALSVLVYIFDYVILILTPTLIRESIAKFLILTSIFLIMKARNKKQQRTREYTFLLFFSLLGVVMAHYTASYFLIVIILCLFLTPYAARIVRHLPTICRIYFSQPYNILSERVLLFSVVIVLSWNIFISYSVFYPALKGLVPFLNELVGLTPYAKYHGYSAYIFSFPRGGAVSMLLTTVYRMAIVFGFIYALKSSKDIQALGLTMIGGSFLVILFFWILVPKIASIYGYSDRPYNYGIMLFSFFVALSLTKIPILFKPIKKGKILYPIKAILSWIMITSFLVNHIYVMPPILYRSSSTVPIEQRIVIPVIGDSELVTSDWIDRFTCSDALYASDDLKGYHISQTFADRRISNLGEFFLKKPDYVMREVNYFLISKYTIQYGYIVLFEWHTPEGADLVYSQPTGVEVIYVGTDKVQSIFLCNPFNNLVYSNDECYIFQ